MTESPRNGSAISDLTIDVAASGLFLLLVGLLYLGYADPGFPYTSFATASLFGALALLFWANLRADRTARPTA